MSAVFTRSARADLRDIARYYATANQQYGTRLTDALREQVRRLEKSPRIGRPREDLAEGLRSFVVLRYIIYYRETDRGIAVVRIIHGRRNITPDTFLT